MSRRSVESKDLILGNVCVERGWFDSEELARCLEKCVPLPNSPSSGSGTPLSRVLLRRKLITEDELEMLWAEIRKVLARAEAPGVEREDDLLLGQFLRSAGEVSEERLAEAFALQREGEGKGAQRCLGEILLEKGFISFAALEDALHAQKAPRTSVTCRVCRTTYDIVQFDPGRVYLCKTCMGELVPSGEVDADRLVSTEPLDEKPESGFGKYQSPTEIGRGGMGVVYKAWDPDHDRWVALKVVRDSGHLEERTRFRREVDIARSLHHHNIVPLFEVTRIGSRYLLSMQCVEGRTLAVERPGLSRAVEIVALVSRAVQYAHSRGIVHRDIKPQNIMIDGTGKPYLLDFGLAKSLETPSAITSVGTVMGTPGFLAPEQAIGRTSRIDRRTDVYSLGAVLYSLVTGQPPFKGRNPLDTFRKIVYEDPVPPSEVAPETPETLEAIVLRCLEKDKNRRYQTARALAEELERFLLSEAL